MVMTGDIVAKQHDHVSTQQIGVLDDRLDAIERHPRIAGMKVGDRGNPERKVRRPLRRGNVVTRNPKPQYGLDAKPICRGRAGEGAQPANETKELTA